ncbi:MAG: ATP-binding protein [Candidatus Onthovivens sp.]|nr:ATP-binding protein [Candidatus Onthovivens sp.]
MNKKKTLFSFLLAFLIAIFLYLISFSVVYGSSLNSLKSYVVDETRQVYDLYILDRNENKLIEEYSKRNAYRLSFIRNDLVKYDSKNVFNDPMKRDVYDVISFSSSELDGKFYYYTIHVSGEDLYIRLGIKESESIKLSFNFLVFGTIAIVIFSIIYAIILNFQFNESYKPLKIQIKKLQKIVGKEKSVEYEEDLKNLALIVRDSRKELEEQFKMTKQSEEKIEFILDSFGEGLVVIDSNYKIIMFNKKASEIFNVSKNDAYGKSFEVMSLAKGIEGNMSMVVQTLRSFDYIEKIEGKVYECLINPINYEWSTVNEKPGASLLMIDITDEYNSREMKKEFFVNASHELKTPLTSIIGYIEMLKEGIINDKDEVENALNKSLRDATRMKKIIFDMLELSSLENQNLRTIEKINSYNGIKQIISSLELEISAKNLDISLCGNKNFILNMNYDDFEKLFKNIIENSIIYNKDNGKISIKINSNKNEIIVQDSGIGIKEDDLSRIFERFYRVDKARSRRDGGTGLGLAIVKHICEYYEISIDVKSKIDIGTMFILTFK